MHGGDDVCLLPRRTTSASNLARSRRTGTPMTLAWPWSSLRLQVDRVPCEPSASHRTRACSLLAIAVTAQMLSCKGSDDSRPHGVSPAVSSALGATDKTTEAVRGVLQIYDGARLYYFAANNSPPGERWLLRGHIGPMPPLGLCCKSRDHACAPPRSAWDFGLWPKLRFAMTDPHYYSYEYESDGASFTARAFGDLDCDGEFSTFEVAGTIQSLKEGRIPEVHKSSELE